MYRHSEGMSMGYSVPGTAWISVAEAAKRSGLSEGKVRQLVRTGVVSVLDLPGIKSTLSWPDLARAIEAGTRPAKEM
jgi:hypothetical protein